MNDTTSSPSRLLKITAATARWLLGLLVGAWLLLALSVLVLHIWIVPRIADYRPALEAQASRAIGVPVRIGSIGTRSGGLFPTIELGDVVLLDANGHESLRLTRVLASFSPRSLWRLSFEQLYIEGPQVEMRRDAQGRIHVAGLDLQTDTGTGTGGGDAGTDWFFSQREVVVQGGTVRWTDELRQAPPLLLTDVMLVARNAGLRHTMRLDATPPAGWGQRLSLRGDLRQPLLSVRNGNWKNWSGQLYAELPYIDVTHLDDYVEVDARFNQGSGGLRLWADVDHGRIAGGTVDLALNRVDTVLGKALQPLILRDLTGRLSGRHGENGALQFATERLQFDTIDGLRWPGGNLAFQYTPVQGRDPERGSLRADRLDLGALALIADRLPLGDKSLGLIAAYQPHGLVEGIDASWQGPAENPSAFHAKGRVSALAIAARTAEHGGSPGLRGATVDFELSQSGGSATLDVSDGALELPEVFEEPVVPVARLSAQVQWKRDGPALQVQVSGLRFSNADAEGHAEANWRTSDPSVSRGHDRFPGLLDLQGKLTRADGTRVFRYLPLVIPKATRDYVRDAVTKGAASEVDFKVRGDLHDMPFTDPRLGDFRIAAKVADVSYAYVPPPAPPVSAGTPVWPALNGLAGELVFERAGMEVRNARGRLGSANSIEVTRADAQIPDMGHLPMLKVDAQAKGPLAELLKVGGSLAGEVGPTLAAMRAGGNADYKLHLDLPLAALDKAKVQASIALADNDLQLLPEAPALGQVRGTLNFTESGFSANGVQARALGGALRIDGGGRFGGKVPELDLRVQGNLTADGLRAARELDALARFAKNTSGGTAYSANFSLHDGATEFLVSSSLQGLGLQLPAPFSKSADDTMPLKVEKKVVQRNGSSQLATGDQLSFELGKVASATYLRDISGSEPRILRGAIGVGLVPPETTALPDRGVAANLRFGRLDIGAWQALFSQASGSTAQMGPVATAAAAGTDDADELSAWLPTVIALRAQALLFGGRTLNDVVLGGTREGPVWRANIDSTELSGYAEYRPAQAGRLYARLARLKILPSEADAVESLLDEQPSTLPALDITVDEFELFGRQLGQAQINAVNRGGAAREWRLNKLSFSNPDASFSAQGSWGAQPGRDERLTNMDFKLEINDAGALLGRLGMKDVLRRGHGRLEGNVNWVGSPFTLDHASLGGQLQIDVENGQFLKADPGIAKLLGVLSLQALPRRLTLDFRDVFSAGFAFDFLRGDAAISKGVASTNNLQMKGVNAAVLMAGSADIARETQNIRVVVVPEINAGTAALVATAINPVIGLGTFLAQAVLSRPLILAATQEFQIDGTWTDPKITRVPHRTSPEALGTPTTPPAR
jgi:uncharacterized protein (TIGR02099 family)